MWARSALAALMGGRAREHRDGRSFIRAFPPHSTRLVRFEEVRQCLPPNAKSYHKFLRAPVIPDRRHASGNRPPHCDFRSSNGLGTAWEGNGFAVPVAGKFEQTTGAISHRARHSKYRASDQKNL
jgi:hypothetical protein